MELHDLADNGVSAARLPRSRLACRAAVIAIVIIAAGARLNVFASLFLLQIVTIDVMKKSIKYASVVF